MSTTEPTFEPRAICPRCMRPTRVCYCAHLTQIETRTRVVVLQHPRERYVPIGTARIANLCLPNSELHVGVRWDDSAALRRAVSDPERPAALLYPGEGARDVMTDPPGGPITLVVVDGTWSNAKKLVTRNPLLSALPRYAFTPPKPSEYRIRPEPKDDYVSTIEALAYVLGALEGDPARFDAMLVPFRAMVDMQLACERQSSGDARRKRLRGRKAPPPHLRLPDELRERAEDLVCVVGEANTWPYRTENRHRDEIVHWLACRVATGETFEAVCPPRGPSAPGTTHHTELSDAELAAGASWPELLARWRAFLGERAVVCSWGHYATRLFVEEGGALGQRVDLRAALMEYRKARVGTMEAVAEEVGAGDARALGRGRGGRRLAGLVAIARWMVRAAHPGSAQ